MYVVKKLGSKIIMLLKVVQWVGAGLKINFLNQSGKAGWWILLFHKILCKSESRSCNSLLPYGVSVSQNRVTPGYSKIYFCSGIVSSDCNQKICFISIGTIRINWPSPSHLAIFVLGKMSFVGMRVIWPLTLLPAWKCVSCTNLRLMGFVVCQVKFPYWGVLLLNHAN